MYPVVENGRPRDKENPAFYHKSSKLFTFSKWKLGKRILSFHWAFMSATESASKTAIQDEALIHVTNNIMVSPLKFCL
jgi:hypothetical protein